MAPAPTLHLLDREDYSKHRLVTLPSDPLPPLGPSSIRIQSRILGLTTNNFTYARMGHLIGWWNVFPIPGNTPAPYNDKSKFGRISAWGYAEILESTVPDIPAGKTIYGYLPISNLPEDLRIEQTGLKDHIVVLNEHRQHLWMIYNRYQVCAPLAELERSKGLDFLGWDALMQPLFGTSYNMNLHAFAWEDEKRIHPGGKGDWTAKDADLADATVVLLSASGKTALSFAHQLRQNRPKAHQPRSIVAVCSPASKSTTEKTGFYDRVVEYSDAEAVKQEIESASAPSRTVLIDFGAREGAREQWDAVLSTLKAPFAYTLVGVGREVKPMAPEAATRLVQTSGRACQTNANELREKGISLGGEAYLDEFHSVFDRFKAQGGIPGVGLEWGEGMGAWEEGWEAYCKDQVMADRGLVYRL